MMRVPAEDRLAQALVTAIKGGDQQALAALLVQHPALAGGLVVEDGGGRTALHLLADAPGGRPRRRETVRVLVEAGAEPNAQAVGMWHEETQGPVRRRWTWPVSTAGTTCWHPKVH